MKILLTNDDGYGSEGLMELETALSQEHEVYILAPAENKSGCSQALTIGRKIRLNRHTPRHFSANANPADCVILAKGLEFLPDFDLVVSGINHGPNIGTDVVYSGTAAGARQAFYMGMKGIALSYASYQMPGDFTRMAQVFSKMLDKLLSPFHPKAFLNVNFPKGFRGEEKWVQSSLSPRRYEDWISWEKAGKDSWDINMEGKVAPLKPQEGTDWEVLNRSQVSFTWVQGEPHWVMQDKEI